MQKTTGQLLMNQSDFSASGEYYSSWRIYPILSEEKNDGTGKGSNGRQSAAEGAILSIAFKDLEQCF